jgi:dienelactone hydrolase
VSASTVGGPLSPRTALLHWMAAHPPEFDVQALDRDGEPPTAWQERLRTRLWELLGGRSEPPRPELEVDAEVRQEDGFSVRRLTYAVEPGVRAAAWLLTPDPGRRRPGGVLALHGHGRGKDDALGPGPDGSGREYGGFAAEFARRGLLVLCPDARGFGERADPAGTGCHVLGLASLLLGRSLVAQRLHDDLVALGLLRALSGSTRLAAVGLSEGGKRALWLGAMDERVTVTVVSGYFTRVRREIEAWDRLRGWDICNAVPGLLAVADLPELAALCAPRALCLDWGRADGLYTPDAVEEAAAAVAAAYERLGAAERFRFHVHEGGHRFGGEPVLDWVVAQLGR